MSRLRKIALDAGGVAVGGAAGRGMGRGREHGDAPCLGIDRLGEQVVRRPSLPRRTSQGRCARRLRPRADHEEDDSGNVREVPIMLNGDKVVLRPVRERDLAAFINAHTEISNRGEFFPLGVQPEPALRRSYAETA